MTPLKLIQDFWPDVESIRIAPLTNVAGDAITAWEVKVLVSGDEIEAFSAASYVETLRLAGDWLSKRREHNERLDSDIRAALRGEPSPAVKRAIDTYHRTLGEL